nr:unnamed protein product [Callosobruchus analis]
METATAFEPGGGGEDGMSSYVRAEDESRPDSPSTLEVICRQLRDEHSGLLKECAALRNQLEDRDKIIERLANEISNMSNKLSVLMVNKNRKEADDPYLRPRPL